VWSALPAWNIVFVAKSSVALKIADTMEGTVAGKECVVEDNIRLDLHYTMSSGKFIGYILTFRRDDQLPKIVAGDFYFYLFYSDFKTTRPTTLTVLFEDENIRFVKCGVDAYILIARRKEDG